MMKKHCHESLKYNGSTTQQEALIMTDKIDDQGNG